MFSHAIKHISDSVTSAGTKFLVSRTMGSTKPYDAEVEYVESNGTQYVDTGIYADASSTEFDLDCSFGGTFTTSNTTNVILDGHDSSNVSTRKAYQVNFGGTSGQGNMAFCWFEYPYVQGQSTVYKFDNTFVLERCHLKYTVGTVTRGNVSINVPYSSGVRDKTLLLAASMQDDGTVVPFGAYSMRAYSFRIWNNVTLVRDFQPVRIGQVGYLYDKVSGELFGSATATPLIAGPDRCKIKPVLKHYDMAVKYRIDECNGNLQTVESASFPSGKYTALDYTPTYEHHRFVGWQNSSQDGEAEFLDSLPTGYTYPDGGNIVLTGVHPGPNTSFEIKARALNQTMTNMYGISGVAAANGECRWGCDETIDGVRTRYFINVNIGGWSSAQAFYNTNNDNGNYASFRYKSTDIGIFGYDASSKTVYTKTDANVVVNSKVLPDETTIKQFVGEFKFFGCPANSSMISTTTDLTCRPTRLYYAKFWESGVLIRDYVPYVKDGVACLYDKVNGTFLYNYGTGIMMSGPLKDTPVEYISPSDKIIYDAKLISAVWQSPTTVTFDATTNGGQMPSDWTAPDYYEGQPYGTLPTPTKSGEVFLGWFDGSGNRVTESTAITSSNTSLTARYAAITYDTSFEVTTTSSYKKAGIYSATSRNSSNPTVVDWGDGSYNVVYGNISQLVHEYATVGTFTIQVNNNISSIGFSWSSDDTAWTRTTTHNNYILKKIKTLSSNITSLPTGAFMRCEGLQQGLIPTNASFTIIPQNCFAYCTSMLPLTIPSNVTTIGNRAFQNISASQFNTITIPATVTTIDQYAFYCCYYLHPVFASGSANLTLGDFSFAYCGFQGSAFIIDLSPRRITTIPSYCFYYCRYLKGVTWPQELKSIGGSAFWYCFNYAASTGTVEIPEGVTSISGTNAFRSCFYLTAVTLPSTLTTLNNYTFSSCTRLATITSNRSTAPTVSSTTFGNSTGSYTGRTSYSAGTNKLYVPAGATGYNASYWASVLLDSTKCGFTLEEMP